MRPKASQDDVNQLALALGSAMAAFGKVENQLYLLYGALCEPRDVRSPYSVIYETIVHLDTKLSIIDELVKFKIKNPELLNRWATLHNKIKNKIRRVRNKIAHWRLWTSSDEKHLPVFLGPPLYFNSNDVPDFGTAHGGAMTAKDLWGHAKNFEALAQEIRDFIHAYKPGALPRKSVP